MVGVSYLTAGIIQAKAVFGFDLDSAINWRSASTQSLSLSPGLPVRWRSSAMK